MAPLKTVTRKAGGKPVNRFLSRVAKDAIHDRRRLERRWKRSLDENDRTAYRRQCRETNRLINESRRLHYAERIGDMTSGAKKRWNAVNDLLHTNDRGADFSPDIAEKQCTAISSFLSTKLVE